ncbi:MAG TPA: phosphatidylinositol-specific phospholipase C1-like protein [Dinghuibacter sp.]|uniref:phosphatidylinositol-specific phospholipase C1-like protein n=1 Tax=Dinghuibacter sp. TaxID=2024697 RepID=UPI002C5F9EF9|nr:phosphatidylinositol-specific phospholipase C1-like protein [Dinghuibacter sp.]HTJ13249.1 phosphatidylinositol-specific phospholipase C1-like protein [Dinghuibacter sp.]
MDDLPLNMIQVIGSHNSYKEAIDPPLFNIIRFMDQSIANSLDYTHLTLSEQLSMGLCNLEIDVYADEHGGKYAHPKGLSWEGKAAHDFPYDPKGEMIQPGFKIMHIQDVDFRSSCLTLTGALRELKAWSDAHKGHPPVFITVNAKDDRIPGLTRPEKFTGDVFDRLDKALIEGLGADKLLTPDEVRGSAPTLERAVLDGRWPSVTASRGKFVFILDEKGRKRDAYIAGHPSLRNRVFFVNALPGTPEAAFMIINDPIKYQGRIRDLVRQGYIVRTRADEGTTEARRNDMNRFHAACSSGAQIISTDYYRASTLFRSDYVIRFAGGEYWRANPMVDDAGAMGKVFAKQ